MASWVGDGMDDEEDSHHHHQSHIHDSFSNRVASRSRNISTIGYENLQEDDDDDDGVKTMLSRLSIESFDAGGDADEELSDGNGGGRESDFEDVNKGLEAPAREAGPCCSLPVTPVQHRRREGLLGHFIKQYASENDAEKAKKFERRRRRRKRVLERGYSGNNDDEDDDGDGSSCLMKMEMGSGESESGGGLRVITRPKGGKSSLCMDMEEVKACRDLGFDLELDMKMMPSRLTLSASTLDTATSSGGSSPISNWRISSPGDDPKDVKARLKVWAQAVAIASTSPKGSG